MATAKKASAPEAPAKKVATKAAAKSTATATAAPAKKRTPNPAFMKPLTLSPELAAVVGDQPLPRTEIVSKLWDKIKKRARGLRQPFLHGVCCHVDASRFCCRKVFCKYPLTA